MTARQPPSAGQLWPDQDWCDVCGFALSGTCCEVCAEPDHTSEEYLAWASRWVWTRVPPPTGSG